MPKKWDDMTPAERRVALAKDVIKQIHAKKIEVRAGWGFVAPKYDAWGSFYDLPNDIEHEEVISKDDVNVMKKDCYVCAMGALFLSRVDKFNKITWGDLNCKKPDHDSIVKALRGSFSRRQLVMIENAFERYDGDGCEFGDALDDEDDRLLAIMQNIVDHDGTFEPKVAYVVS